MSLEQKINYQLNKIPVVKKVIKRVYQRMMYAVSPKTPSKGRITRISPDDCYHEFFFGYYDKSPWDITDRYMLCLRARNTWSDVSPKEKADILLIDTNRPDNDSERIKKIAETNSWNVQQGCMLQWLGPDFSSKIIFNDYRNGSYVAVVLDIATGIEKIIPAPVYTVSQDGRFAITLDFSRLYNLRPGYGYYNIPETTKDIALPDSAAVWKVDLQTGIVSELLSYKDFVSFQPRPEMLGKDVIHKVNHLMISPDGSRCMVLYRWFVGHRKYTRLITFNTSDGEDMFLLSDDDMVSHCCWKNNQEILAFENKKVSGPGYYLMKDKSLEYVQYWPQLNNDGHPSYSPDGGSIVTDTYPDRKRMAKIKLMDGRGEKKTYVKTIVEVFAPFKYDNDTRCDLHPRWNHKGNMICFDSVFEGHRGLYVVDVKKDRQKISDNRIVVCFIMTACKKSGPVQQMLNIIKHIDRSAIKPVLVTIYPEPTDGSSQLDQYLPYVKHYFAPTGKVDIIMGRTQRIKRVLSEINPNVIHSLGVFPDYAISIINQYPQIITLRNFVWDDYPAKYGRIRGAILARLHLYAMNHTNKTVTCSKSLSEIYRKKLGFQFDYIRNGVDVDQFSMPDADEKKQIRQEKGLPEKSYIFIYSGQIIERKNHAFLLETFREFFSSPEVYLLILGDGMDYEKLYDEFGSVDNIDFRGVVNDVNVYLKACDAYVSTSKSEGMPNGVMEAMATGLPVILSDIDQHKEIMRENDKIGFLYEQGNKRDLADKMRRMMHEDSTEMSKAAYNLTHKEFDSASMSSKYQNEYRQLAEHKKDVS